MRAFIIVVAIGVSIGRGELRAAVDAGELLPQESRTLTCTLDGQGTCTIWLPAAPAPQRILRPSVQGVAGSWVIDLVDQNQQPLGTFSSSSSSGGAPRRVSGGQIVGFRVAAPGAAGQAVTIAVTVVTLSRPLGTLPSSGAGVLLAPNTIRSQSGRVQEFAKSVVRLVFTPLDRRARACTGFLVTPDVVMTNEHCISDLGDAADGYAELDFNDEQANPKAVSVAGLVDLTDADRRRAAELDVALLRLESAPGRTPLTLSTHHPVLNANAILIGHPGGAAKVASLAGCRLVESAPEPGPAAAAREVAHSCFTKEGSSGAPVIDFEDGTVVALHHAGFEEGGQSRTNRAVAMDQIVAWLKTVPNLPIVTQ